MLALPPTHPTPLMLLDQTAFSEGIFSLDYCLTNLHVQKLPCGNNQAGWQLLEKKNLHNFLQRRWRKLSKKKIQFLFQCFLRCLILTVLDSGATVMPRTAMALDRRVQDGIGLHLSNQLITTQLDGWCASEFRTLQEHMGGNTTHVQDLSWLWKVGTGQASRRSGI